MTGSAPSTCGRWPPCGNAARTPARRSSCSARSASTAAWFPIPAATVTARTVSTTTASNGWNDSWQRQVPGAYFLLTFTLPAEFRALAWAHQQRLYDLLIGCAWQSVHTFSRNDRQLQGTPGAIAVLHTNTRRLDYHPHVHLRHAGGRYRR